MTNQTQHPLTDSQLRALVSIKCGTRVNHARTVESLQKRGLVKCRMIGTMPVISSARITAAGEDELRKAATK